MADNAPPLRLLSLDDGGGIGGLSSLLILESLMDNIHEIQGHDHNIEPWQVFDLIGGSGTGGLFAIMLGRLRMSVQECIDEYSKLSRISLAPKGRGILDNWKAFITEHPKYDTAEIDKWLKGMSEQSGAPFIDDSGQTGRVYVVHFLLPSYCD